jgi:Tfp pilus assembly protein PilF
MPSGPPPTGRARAFDAKHDYARAADFEKALNLDRENAVAYVGRAAIRIAKANCDGAIANCNAAIKIEPRFASAYRLRSRAWEAKGGHKCAETDAKTASSLDKK